MENNRFVFMQNQYTGGCLPCTSTEFDRLVDDPDVAWKISMRQAVEAAVNGGRPLQQFVLHPRFQDYCKREEAKGEAGGKFRQLTDGQKLLRWVSCLKSSLPCLVFAVSAFEAVPRLGKDGQPVLDASGQPVLYQRRTLEGIRQLSGLFMFDADHLPMDPHEVFLRTQVSGFPWQVGLCHKTSSGHGLRLVCEARPELGNIADNQIELARELQLLGVTGTTGKPVVDDSCIDASRISYCPRREDIYSVDYQILFNSKTLC